MESTGPPSDFEFESELECEEDVDFMLLESELLEYLFADYNPNLKPTERPGVKIHIDFRISIDQILDLKIIEESLISRLILTQKWLDNGFE